MMASWSACSRWFATFPRERRAADELRAAQRALEEANATLEKTVEPAHRWIAAPIPNLAERWKTWCPRRRLWCVRKNLPRLGVWSPVLRTVPQHTDRQQSAIGLRHWLDCTNEFAHDLSASNQAEPPFAMFIEDTREASQILLRNLEKAGEIIRSFKQVAVDEAASQRRAFALREVVDEVLLAHRPMLRNSHVDIHTDVPADLWLDSYPGPLGQVLGNLITNAVLHGYEGKNQGLVEITAIPRGHEAGRNCGARPWLRHT